VQAGRGGVVVIVGEPGIGKTELAEHAAGVAAGRGCTVGWGRCRETAGAPPFWPWKLALTVLGAGSWERLVSGAESRFAVFERVTEALRRRAEGAPLLVVLDDVHAADEASLDLLRFLVAQLLPARAGFVVTARDSAGPGELLSELGELGRSRDGVRIDLGGLSREEVETWMAAEGLAEADADLVVSRTGGNPFFVREVVRLQQSGVRQVPSAVRDVIRERVAQLPELSSTVLGAAAVLGRDVDVPVLAAMLETSPARAAADLAPALQAQLLVPAVDGALGQLRFVHDLTREVVVADLEAGQRMRLHARALAVLPFTGMVEPSDLAGHAVRAIGWVPADVVWQATGDAARDADRRMAWGDAATWWRAALDVAVPAGVDEAQRCQVGMALGRAELRHGQVAAARDAFESVAAWALAQHRLGSGRRVGAGGRRDRGRDRP
jgi:energy-coupling factor transporter ATP-binding protein EcfA2